MSDRKDDLNIVESETRQFQEEFREMSPEVPRPFKLETVTLSNSILKTAYEELFIIYKVDARFRTGYSETPETVTVPNLFCKVFCSPKSKPNFIKQYQTEAKTHCYQTTFNGTLYMRQYGDQAFPEELYTEGRLNREQLARHPLWQLNSLKPAFQKIWLDKLEFILNNRDNLFTPQFTLTPGEMIETIIRIKNTIIDLYNAFDFQGVIPKIIIDDSNKPYDQKEAQKSSLCLLFFALTNFDVVVFNDTHGATFENYITESSYNKFYSPEIQETPRPKSTSLVLIAIVAIGGIALLTFIFKLLF